MGHGIALAPAWQTPRATRVRPLNWIVTFGTRALRYRGTMFLLLVAVGATGCVFGRAPHSHSIDFHGTVVDGASGAPISGSSATVQVGNEVVFDGATGADGTLAFTHELVCGRRDGVVIPRDRDNGRLSVTIKVETGEYGTVEIPVRFDHGTHNLSLGTIRLVREEGE